MIERRVIKKDSFEDDDIIADILEDGQVTDYEITPKDICRRPSISRNNVDKEKHDFNQQRPRILIE